MKWFNQSVRLINRTPLRDVRVYTFLEKFVEWLVKHNIKSKCDTPLIHFTIRDTTRPIATENKGLIVEHTPVRIEENTAQYLMHINLGESSFLHRYDADDDKFKAEEYRHRREMLLIFLEEACGFSDAEEAENIVESALSDMDSTHSIFKPRIFTPETKEARTLDYEKMDEYIMLVQFLQYDYAELMPTVQCFCLEDITMYAGGNKGVMPRLRFVQEAMEAELKNAADLVAKRTMERIAKHKEYLTLERDKLYVSFEVGYSVRSKSQYHKPKKHGWDPGSAKAARRTS